jgi:hypothetical protein
LITAQTPPTREPRIGESLDGADPPELLLADHLRSKVTLARRFALWKETVYLRRKKRRLFQLSLSAGDFDADRRIGSISDANTNLPQRTFLRGWRGEALCARAVATVRKVLQRRILCHSFGHWRSQYLRRLSSRLRRRHQKIETWANARAPDLLGKLHKFITRRAELETELERREREVADFHAVIDNNELELAQLESQIRDNRKEKQRLYAMREKVDEDYRDQIAILRMALSHEIGSRRSKIEEAKQKLEMQQRAKKISSASFGESLEALQSRRGDLRERLNRAQSVAMRFRDEILETDDEQTAATAEIAQARLQIAQLRRDCDALLRKGDEDQEALRETVDELDMQYQEALQELEHAAKVSEQYNVELSDQDGSIEILAREFALSQQRYQTTLSAFQQDDEVPVDAGAAYPYRSATV